MVLQPVQLQIEKALQFLGPGRPALSPPASHLDFLIEGFGPPQILQCLLLAGDGLFRVASGKRLMGRVHGLDGLDQVLEKLLYVLVEAGQGPPLDSVGQGLGALLQLELQFPDQLQGVPVFLLLQSLPIANQSPGGYQDLLLAPGEQRIRTCAPPAAPGSRLALQVLLAERTHFQKINVAGGGRTSVGGPGEITDEVPRLEIEFLQEERMGRRDRPGEPSALGFEKLNLGRPGAVEGVVQLQVPQTEVIVGLGFGQDLLQSGGLPVSPRPDPGQLGRLILEGGNGVGVGFDPLAGPALGELDSIGRVPGDLDVADDGRPRLLSHRDGSPVPQQNAG